MPGLSPFESFLKEKREAHDSLSFFVFRRENV